jgi:hypothetical protein
MNNPNKDIRKYFFDALNGTGVPVFDSRQAVEDENICYLILDQNNTREDETKCNIATTQTLTIEVIERVQRFGNAGSRVALDDATESLYFVFDNITLTDYNITSKSISDNSVITYDTNEILNRNIVTLTFKIN